MTSKERAALRANHKEEHHIWLALMRFSQEEEKKETDKDNL